VSRIDELIAELCPEGVEFRALDEIFDTRNGYTPAKSNAENWTNGTIPWFRMEDIREHGRVLDDAIQRIPGSALKGGRLFPADSIIVATSATIGEHALITVPFMSNQRFTAMWPKPAFSTRLDMKFVFYYCFVLDHWCLNNTTTSSFGSVDMPGFKRFRFPIPPLEVQQEIVRVLDLFTTLEAELEAELEARQRQYAHYRDSLLTFPEGGVRWVPMGEVAFFDRGTAITAKGVTPGAIPVVANGPVPIYYHDIANRTGETIVVARSGAYAGAVSYWNEPLFLTDAFSIHPDASVVRPKFLFYWLRAQQDRLHEMKKGGGVPHVRVKELQRELVPIPPLDEQKRIAHILDKFDALVNDLSIGLPAELAARRKQYEYYRDRLLTFKEAVA